jgi:uncharacterized protein
VSTLEILGATEYVALTTFRAGGEPVVTPVWAARHGERLVVYTPVRSGKVRRLRRRPHVTVAVSDFTGERRGPAVAGTARVLARSEQGPAVRALVAAYGWRFRWFQMVLLLGRARRAGGAPVVVEVALSNGPDRHDQEAG